MQNLSFYDCLSDEGKQVAMEQFAPTVINSAIELVKKTSEFSKKFEPTLLGLISKNKLKKELELTDRTLDKWESVGLKRYQPPLEDTRKVYYLIRDVLIFLGANS